MTRIFTLILDICFPPRSEELLVRTLSTNTIDALYQEVEYEGTIALLPYSNQIVRALIHEAKFHDNRQAHQLLAYALMRYVHTHSRKDNIFIPIPLSHKRWRERGYNQVHQVLKRTNLTLAINTLYRVRHTTAQTSLDRNNRLNNMKNAFAIKGTIPSQHIIIVDDVLTTGATLTAARQAINEHLAPEQTVTCLAFAH